MPSSWHESTHDETRSQHFNTNTYPTIHTMLHSRTLTHPVLLGGPKTRQEELLGRTASGCFQTTTVQDSDCDFLHLPFPAQDRSNHIFLLVGVVGEPWVAFRAFRDQDLIPSNTPLPANVETYFLMNRYPKCFR